MGTKGRWRQLQPKDLRLWMVLTQTGLTRDPKIFSLSLSEWLFAACHLGTTFEERKLVTPHSQKSIGNLFMRPFSINKKIQICNPGTGDTWEFTDGPSKAWSLR